MWVGACVNELPATAPFTSSLHALVQVVNRLAFRRRLELAIAPQLLPVLPSRRRALAPQCHVELVELPAGISVDRGEVRVCARVCACACAYVCARLCACACAYVFCVCSVCVRA